MNAVTIAEYQVLEHYDAAQLQHMINEHAAQGYKLLHYCAVPDEANRTLNFTAVMVREPKYESVSEITLRLENLEVALQERLTQIAELEHRLAELARRINDLAFLLSHGENK